MNVPVTELVVLEIRRSVNFSVRVVHHQHVVIDAPVEERHCLGSSGLVIFMLCNSMPNTYFTTGPPGSKGKQHMTYYFFNNANPFETMFITTPSMYYTNKLMKRQHANPGIIRNKLIAMSGGGPKGEARARRMVSNALEVRTGSAARRNAGHAGQVAVYRRWLHALGNGPKTNGVVLTSVQKNQFLGTIQRTRPNLTYLKEQIKQHITSSKNTKAINRYILNRLGINRIHGPKIENINTAKLASIVAAQPVRSRRSPSGNARVSLSRSRRVSPRSEQNILSSLERLATAVAKAGMASPRSGRR